MKKGQLNILIIAITVGLIILSGCVSPDNGDTSTDNKPTTNNETSSNGDKHTGLTELTFGYQPSTHQIAYMTADVKGWWLEDLAPFGITKIDGIEFPTGAPEMQAMLAGHIDVAYVGAAPVISALGEGLDAKIVAAVQTQGSNLVLRNEITYNGPEDLKGLKLATFPAGTIQDTLLRDWLKKNGVDPDKDVDIRSMGPSEATTAISAGKVDGVFLPHPAPTRIENGGYGRSVVASGEMMPDHACCVLVVSGNLIQEEPELVKQIIKTHIKATDYNTAHIDEASAIFVEMIPGDDIEVVDKSLAEWDGTWICDPDPIIGSTVNYTQVQYELGYIDKPLTKEDIFDTSFYSAVTE